MSAADDIRNRYADVIERAHLRARAEAGTACHLCSNEHRTNDCPLAQRYIDEIELRANSASHGLGIPSSIGSGNSDHAR